MADGCEPDGCAVGAWVALGVGVPACAGARGDRMPGTDACASEGSDPDRSAPDGWAGDAWAEVGCGGGA